jgi:hypothetical protein
VKRVASRSLRYALGSLRREAERRFPLSGG